MPSGGGGRRRLPAECVLGRLEIAIDGLLEVRERALRRGTRLFFACHDFVMRFLRGGQSIFCMLSAPRRCLLGPFFDLRRMWKAFRGTFCDEG